MLLRAIGNGLNTAATMVSSFPVLHRQLNMNSTGIRISKHDATLEANVLSGGVTAIQESLGCTTLSSPARHLDCSGKSRAGGFASHPLKRVYELIKLGSLG